MERAMILPTEESDEENDRLLSVLNNTILAIIWLTLALATI